MKIATVDQKKRIRIPGTEPGEAFAVREVEPGHYELAKMIPAPRTAPRNARATNAAIEQHALTPAIDWATLRQGTREL
ncbi:MAG: hypothetical protein ACLFVC_07480 [Opitutales bacterium]